MAETDDPDRTLDRALAHAWLSAPAHVQRLGGRKIVDYVARMVDQHPKWVRSRIAEMRKQRLWDDIGPRPALWQKQETTVPQRGMWNVKWTDEMDQALIDGMSQGRGAREFSQQFGCTTGAIYARMQALKRTGRLGPKSEDAASGNVVRYWECPVCQERHQTKDALDKHLADHPQEQRLASLRAIRGGAGPDTGAPADPTQPEPPQEGKRFTCILCGAHFATPEELMRHQAEDSAPPDADDSVAAYGMFAIPQSAMETGATEAAFEIHGGWQSLFLQLWRAVFALDRKSQYRVRLEVTAVKEGEQR